MKVIPVKNCAVCPLSEIRDDGAVECHSAKWTTPRKVGKFDEVVVKRIIPKWCPLESVEEFLEARREMICTKKKR